LSAPNLTQDQQIALQCASESGGSPHAFAICAGGRLAAKELINCRGQRFAEGKCFVEGNELRKLAQKFGTDVGPNSVVAQVANVQLQVLEVQTKPLVDLLPVATSVINKGAEFLPDPTHPTFRDTVCP
jgi:hypothetical protein